jgi:hypothetical protein
MSVLAWYKFLFWSWHFYLFSVCLSFFLSSFKGHFQILNSSILVVRYTSKTPSAPWKQKNDIGFFLATPRYPTGHHYLWIVPQFCTLILLFRVILKMKMSIDHCWNDNDWEKPNYSENTLSQVTSSVHHKLQWRGPG